MLVFRRFFVFNIYRLGVGLSFSTACAANATEVATTQVASDGDGVDDDWSVLDEDAARNTTTYLGEWADDIACHAPCDRWPLAVSFPCWSGLEYLVCGSAVWLAFLPFHLTVLLFNCYRQCCCCLCDPFVWFATAFDCCRKCLCECGWFSPLDAVWYSMCLFQSE